MQALSKACTVWILDLKQIAAQIRQEPGLMNLIGPSELARSAQYANDLHSESYVAAHIGLRIILAQQYGAGETGKDFSITPNGKPFIIGGPAFSLSRSGPLALVAISEAMSVGIDIERTYPNLDTQSYIRYPILRLFATDKNYQQPDAFIRAWVRMEAWSKRRALAISSILDDNEEEFLKKQLDVFDPDSELSQLTVPAGFVAWCACGPDKEILQKQFVL